MTALPHVTEAESEILETLWRLGPLSPQRLLAEVAGRKGWAATTIKTLLSRLMQKEAVASDRSEGRLRYRPLIDRETYVEAQVQALADRLFEGDRAALAAYLTARR